MTTTMMSRSAATALRSCLAPSRGIATRSSSIPSVLFRNARTLSFVSKPALVADGGRLLLPSSALGGPCPSFFSTSSSRSDLSNLLEREFNEEQHDSAAMPPELDELYQQLQPDWRIVDSDTTGVVRMHHTNLKGVSISFHCQDTLDSQTEEEDDLAEEEEEPAVAVRFVLTYTKAGTTLVLTCLSDMARPIVERVSITKQEDTSGIAQEGIDANLYQGPEITELAEDVQTGFHDFLQNECGVTDDVATFITMYADYKEEVEYVRWLKQVRGVIGE